MTAASWPFADDSPRVDEAVADSLDASSADQAYAGRTAAQWHNHLKSMRLEGSEAAAEVPALIQLLEQESAPPLLRRQAAHTLGRMGRFAEAAVPVFERLLDDTEVIEGGEPPRLWALKGIALMGAPARQAAPRVADILRDRTQPHAQRLAALDALGRIGPVHRQSLSPIAAVLIEGAPPGVSDIEQLELRIAAADSLSRFGASAGPAIPALLRAARDENERLRRIAVATLGQVRDPLALDSLIDVLLFDASPAVQDAAAVSLSEIGAVAVPALTQLLGDSEADIRWRAADALRRLGRTAEPAAEMLESLKHDPSPQVRIHVAEALWATTEDVSRAAPLVLPLFAADERTWRIRAHRLAVEMAGKSRSPEFEATLHRLSDSRDPRIRQTAGQTLRELELLRAADRRVR